MSTGRIVLLLLALAGPAFAADQCLGIDPRASAPISEATKTTDCHVRMSPTGYPLPDPECTPGAINPTVTANVLRNPAWRTRCVRNKATSLPEKHVVYAWYGIEEPPKGKNQGKNQVCELDHLVAIEDGGADTLDNVWPQCGPYDVPRKERFFILKDTIETMLAKEIKDGEEPEGLQRGISEDWSQYVPTAAAAAPNSVPQRPGRRSKPRT